MEVPSKLKNVKINPLNNPIIAPSFLLIINPAKKIVIVKTSILGMYANVYPKTIAKAVNVAIRAIRNVFLSNQTELVTLSVSIFSALLVIIV
jgi:hypothetical protein